MASDKEKARGGAKLTGPRERRRQTGGKRKSHWKDNMLPFCQGGKQRRRVRVC